MPPETKTNFYGGTLQWATGNNDDVSSGVRITGAAQTAYLDTNGNNVTFNTAIAGAGGLTKLGNGALVLNAANSYTGDTNVNGGTLELNTANTQTIAPATYTSTAAACCWPTRPNVFGGSAPYTPITINSGGVMTMSGTYISNTA